ncbi:LacI family DNA-binding transcriptional regulator [Streptosporangium sandarakinum]|uniref:LacI family DNA-binding transcriptional regulator n=1 Tax=Streptosporangium sandarakinum TaxID=1260955 RepID=UPI0034365E1B
MRPTDRRGGQPSIVEVAGVAGVSTATAGRVLGGYGKVSETSRRKVEEAAQRLGYRANGLARSLIQGSTETIGVIVTDVGNSFFASAVRAIADEIRAAGYEMLLANTDADPQTEQRALRMMWEKRVDGVIIAPQGSGSVDHLRPLVDDGLPIVLLDRPLAALPEVDQVIINNTSCARSAVNHLIELGHRHIAVISEAAHDFPRLRSVTLAGGDAERPSAARLVGYLAALRRAGIDADGDLVVHSPYNRAAAERAVLGLLRRRPEVTAIFCTDNVLTSGAVAAIQRSGRRCPDDLSVIGFDDQDWTTLVRPQLTVVRQPRYELGSAAAHRLLQRIEERRAAPNNRSRAENAASGDAPKIQEAQRLVLRGRLIKRASTGPIPLG